MRDVRVGWPAFDMFAFDSDLTLEDMQTVLNAAGPWQWVMHDSYWYGDYLLTRPDEGGSKLAIMEQRQSPMFAGSADDPRFVIWVYGSSSGTVIQFIRLERVVREEILPVIGARGLQEFEGF